MKEGRALETVGNSTAIFDPVGHARRSAGEHANLGQKDVFLLEVVKEGLEVGTTEVGGGAKASEQAAAGDLLEVPLTDVLHSEGKGENVILVYIYRLYSCTGV